MAQGPFVICVRATIPIGGENDGPGQEPNPTHLVGSPDPDPSDRIEGKLDVQVAFGVPQT